MNNKMILIGSLIVVALVGLYMMFANKAPDAVAEQPVVQELPVAAAPEVTAPVAQTEPVVQPEAKAEPVSLGASSSGLGR